MQSRGFSLVELVVTMVILGILAVVGMGLFSTTTTASVQSASDQLMTGLRLAQATAMAQRRDVYVVLTASPASLQVCWDASCTQAIAPPNADDTWLARASDLQLSVNSTFSFGPNGAPSLASALQVRVQTPDGTAQSQVVTVEAVTGHVHAP